MLKKQTGLPAFLFLFFVMLGTICCNKEDQPSSQPPPSPPPTARPGTVRGKVLNEYNQLLSGAILNISRNGINISASAANGNYIFDSLQTGSYTLSVKKDGYLETSASISVTAGDTTLKDFVLKAGTAYLNLLTDSVIVAKPFAGTITLKIASNTSWIAANTNNWLTPDKISSNGDDSVVVKVEASPEDTLRQGIIVLQTGSIVKKVLVKQPPEVKLKQTMIIPGNSVLGIKDSIALVFNQPVTVQSIVPGYTFCQSEIRFSYSGNRVSFSYACAALGGDYPFTITTNNSLGDQYTFTFSVGFYEKLINLPGTIQTSFVNDADDSYWIMTDHPNALYKIDMTSFEILHKYDLPNEVATFTISPYNNKVYLAYRRIPKLFILNQDGTTDQVIDVPRDTTRGLYEYESPYTYPSMIAFTKDGKGMIWLGTISGTYYPYYWFIDAAADHRIWYQPLPGSEVYYHSPKLNHDKTKIVVSSVNNNPAIGIFDLKQMTFSSFRPAKYDIAGFVTPSRINDYLYIGQLYFQLVANPLTGFETPTVNRDNRNGGNVDFCYKPGKDLTVYFTEGNSMETIDYSTGKTLVKYDAIYGLKGTTSTLDGKHIIANWSNGNYNAKVVQLAASWFD
jgi:hypothetical protein